MRRELGAGRWDKKLIQNMVDLSVADSYDEAKHEWIATGEVWWSGLGGMPDWAATHHNKCLCGHDIVYHFEILNTENDVRECVGSDHINSYLIFRAIKEENPHLTDDMITDELIEQWITVRVDALKSKAWWRVNGEEFTNMFDRIKDLDLRVNVRKTGARYYDSKLQLYRDKTFVRKVSDGKFGESGYKMASILWRWNHPENTKAQINSKGYPNQRLWNDLLMFFFNVNKAEEIVKKEDDFVERRTKVLEKHKENQLSIRNEQIKRRIKVASQVKEIVFEPVFVEICDFYGVKPFVKEQGSNTWEENFLNNIKELMGGGMVLTETQVTTLWNILDGDGQKTMASDKQKSYLVRLNFVGDVDELTKHEASEEIRKLKGNWR
mgnify:CR=1 FL=1|tara:strand:- start:1413 stop:2552 length:1140 start_codon:yes stop_codon:yes gene_type:complete